ncbi:DNA double-strand break repair nuclease NurA [Candidatus Micrarchaeota archaeon]|nr:DNA double-strand break repair nuclease NurA [Candidatus Micrarchaeota archaeon]
MAGLSEVAEAIKSSEERIKSIAERFRKNNSHEIGGALDGELFVPVKSDKIDYSVCAVDGGLISERFHGSDMLVGKAVAVLFEYSGSKFSSCRYLPQKFPPCVVDARLGLDERESQVYSSLFRLGMEIKTAIDAVKRFSPEVLLFDGSLLPLPSDMPAKESAIYPEYNKVLALYAELYETCKGRCTLIGVIKDTRSRRLVSALGIADEKMSDSYFANFLLRRGERTCIFPYAKEDTPATAELKKFGRVCCFYLKPSETDLPLRIEFVDDGDAAGRVPAIINSLSSISENYAYPAALIEADLCAAMDPLEMEKVKSELSAMLGGPLRPLRRNARPFR